MRAYKFVKWDVDPLESLKDSEIYKAIESAEKGDLKPLKDMYKYLCFGSEYLIYGSYRLQGWAFSVAEFCKTYLVREKYENTFRKLLAPNKTCLYNILGGRHRIDEIYEIGVDAK